MTTTTSQGGPWPSGDVRHVWTTACRCTVTVLQHWRGRWESGPERGTIREEVVTVGSLPGFPVDQIQAVRNR